MRKLKTSTKEWMIASTNLKKRSRDMRKSKGKAKKSRTSFKIYSPTDDPEAATVDTTEDTTDDTAAVEKEHNMDFQPAGRIYHNNKQDVRQRDKVDKVTTAILGEPVGTFRSSWALGIQEELKKAAMEQNNKEDSLNRQEYNQSTHPTNWQRWERYRGEEETPETWEERYNSPILKTKPQT